MEVTDHQTHLKSVTEQAQGLVNEINQLEGQAKSKISSGKKSNSNVNHF